MKYAESTVSDYAPEGTAEAMWSPYEVSRLETCEARRRARRAYAYGFPPQLFAGGGRRHCLNHGGGRRSPERMRTYETVSLN